MKDSIQACFKDVRSYPQSLLKVSDRGIHLPVTYKRSWDDGFGARGWKLDATIGDPEIIASTRETGQRINTSVFVHDILDHFLSGFGVSGHRNEAMALAQLAQRTRSDPTPDYGQMIEEDILRGRVNGESMLSFLPQELSKRLPPEQPVSDREAVTCLQRLYTDTELKDLLMKHFFAIGNSGMSHAGKSWEILGLDQVKRTALGLALQQLLTVIDTIVEQAGVSLLQGFITVNNRQVSFYANDSNGLDAVNGHTIEIENQQVVVSACHRDQPRARP